MKSVFIRYVSLFFLVLLVSVSQVACSFFSKPKSTPQVVERVLKKKIVITGFEVAVPAQVEDIDDIAQGFPREIASRLEYSGNYLVRQSKNLLSFNLKQDTPSAQLVKQVAAQNDAQFVIAGEIRNAGIRSDKKYWGLWETRRRHIEIEFAIYDGNSGAFLSRHHLYRPSEDDHHIGRDKPFGSVAFYATSYGKAIDSVLEESVAWIRKDLSPFPMVAKVVRVSGQQITLDAGLNSNLVVGDHGLVVSDYDQLPVIGLTSQQAVPLQYGVPQASMGLMKVVQVQFGFVVGELAEVASDSSVKVKVGDFVRFDAK